MKQTLLALTLVCSIISGFGQHAYWTRNSPYQLHLSKDLLLGGSALGLALIGEHVESHEAILNFDMGSLGPADIDNINFLDRGVAGRWDVQAKDAGKIFKFTAKRLVPLGLLALPGDVKSRVTLAVIYAEGVGMARGLTALSKGLTNRLRPYTYLTLDQISRLEGEAREEFLEDIQGDDIEDSFFSGDAVQTALGLFFFARTFQDYFPDSKWKKGVWAASITGTALGAYFRAKSGKHFPTDVLVGSVVGGSLGFFLPLLHKHKATQSLSILPTPQGLSITYLIR
ncbi:MAG: phosphatase PAP2 family protein [Bacteroidota bacterium]